MVLLVKHLLFNQLFNRRTNCGAVFYDGYEWDQLLYDLHGCGNYQSSISINPNINVE